MIEIDVQDYCHTCPEFIPQADIDTLYADDDICDIHTVVSCRNKEKCDRIKSYLETRGVFGDE